MRDGPGRRECDGLEWREILDCFHTVQVLELHETTAGFAGTALYKELSSDRILP